MADLVPLNFSRWAVVGPNDDAGLGRMARDMRAVLPLGYQIVIPSERFFTRPLKITDRLLTKEASDTEVREALADLDGIFVLERTWNPLLLPLAKQLGKRIVCVPMWEWFNSRDKEWLLCDLFICPNLHSLQEIKKLGFRNATYLPWTININRLEHRVISGPAKTFFHNAGWVDQDDRKGTRDTISAFSTVPDPDLKLIVRMQKEIELPKLDSRIEIFVGNLPDEKDLYRAGEVAIQPSKMEGLGFMVLEPVCVGIPVITTNYGPMNEFVCQPELRVATRWFKRKAYATNWVKQAHLRLPRISDISRKIFWCSQNELHSVSVANRQWAEQTFSCDNLSEQWRATLNAFCQGELKHA